MLEDLDLAVQASQFEWVASWTCVSLESDVWIDVWAVLGHLAASKIVGTGQDTWQAYVHAIWQQLGLPLSRQGSWLDRWRSLACLLEIV